MKNARTFHGWTPELQATREDIRAHGRYVADLLRQQADTRSELARVLAGDA